MYSRIGSAMSTSKRHKLNHEDQAVLQQFTSPIEVEDGDISLSDGNRHRNYYFLQQGTVELGHEDHSYIDMGAFGVIDMDEDDPSKWVCDVTMESGECLNVNYLKHSKYPLILKAKGKCNILHLEASQLSQLKQHNPGVYQHIIEAIELNA